MRSWDWEGMGNELVGVQEEAQVELAPAAGHGIGRKLAEVMLADPGFVKDLADAFRGSLKATTWYYDSGSKERVEVADNKTRLAAAMGILANMEGEPVKRVIHQHLGVGGESAVGALDAAMAGSEGLREAMRRKVEKAEREAARIRREKERAEREAVVAAAEMVVEDEGADGQGGGMP